MDVRPLTSRIARLLARKEHSIRDVSERTWQLAPGETTSAPRAIFLDADLERVSGVGRATTREHELRRVLGGAVDHRATLAHRLRDVRLLDGHLYCGPMKHRLTTARGRIATLRAPALVDEATLASSLYGNSYFGHFLRDDLTMQLAALDLAPPLVNARAPYAHEDDYRRLLDLRAPAATHAHVRELFVLDDVGQNAFKRARYQTLRDRLRAHAPSSTFAHAGVYIRRGRTGAARLLQNEGAVENVFKRAGFVVVDPATMRVDAMITAMTNAPIVASVEGSQAAHGYFMMADRGTVLVLQPPYRFNNVIKDFTDCMDMSYAFVVGHALHDGFVVDVDALARLLERVLHGRDPQRARTSSERPRETAVAPAAAAALSP